MNIFSSSRHNLVSCIRNNNYGLLRRYLKYDINLMSQSLYAIPFGIGEWIYGMVIKARLKRDKKLHPTNCDFVCGIYDINKLGEINDSSKDIEFNDFAKREGLGLDKSGYGIDNSLVY